MYTITGRAITETGSPTDKFAKCLTKKGIKMYGTEWCRFSKKQKGLFGDSFQFIDYIDCDQNRGVCTSEGIRGYPTWKINGGSHSGVQQLDKLSQLSNCKLEN